MSARMYNCITCNTDWLAFETEEHRLVCKCNKGDWVKRPPYPSVVHATSQVMVEYYLDSLHSYDEYLEDQFIEADLDSEVKAYQQAIINR